MEEKCLRNMSCRCKLCLGEDVAELLSITKSIKSTITYTDPNDPQSPMATQATSTTATVPPPPQSSFGGGSMPSTEDDAMNGSVSEPMQVEKPKPVKRMSLKERMAVQRGGKAPAAARTNGFGGRGGAGASVGNGMAPGGAFGGGGGGGGFVVAAPPAPAQQTSMAMDVATPPPAPTASRFNASVVSVSASFDQIIEKTLHDDAADMEMTPVESDPTPTMGAPNSLAGFQQHPAQIPMTAMSNAGSSMAVDAEGPSVNAPAMQMQATEGQEMSPDEIMQRVADKNWKNRKEAYEQMKSLFEKPGVRTDQVHNMLELLPKMCEDSNASAMEAAIQAALAYTLRVEPFKKEIVPAVMKPIVDKGFSSRPGIVKLCEELVTAFIEAGAGHDTIEALLEGTKNRKPKVPPACVTCVLEALKAFGPHAVPVASLRKELPALCESTVNGVRPVALNLLAEIHRWLGPEFIQDVVGNLRQAQRTEYETLTKDIVPRQAVPTRTLRGAKPANARGASRGGSRSREGSGNTGEAMANAFDPRDFAETVNLLEKLARSEFRAKLELPKWSEKVEAFKIVLDLIGPVPKLANGEYGELVGILKLHIQDANVNIVAKAVEVLGALADGLRKNFGLYARMMLPELMRKLSDKKSVVLQAVNKSLDQFASFSLPIETVMEEIKLNLDPSKNKAPSARVQVLEFLQRCLTNRVFSVDDPHWVTEYGNAFSNAIDDVDPTVRKAGTDGFIMLYKLSESVAQKLQPQLDEIARKSARTHKTIMQAVGGQEAASSQSRPASRSAFPPSMQRNTEASTSGSGASANPRKSMSRAGSARFGRVRAASSNALLSQKTGPAGGSRAGGASAGGASASSGAPSGVEFTPEELSVAVDEAAAMVSQVCGDQWNDIITNISASAWMSRKAAFDALDMLVKEHGKQFDGKFVEAFVVFLASQTKELKESNINVLRCAFQVIESLAKAPIRSPFPKSVVAAVVPPSVDKIGDRKASELIRSMILQLCECLTPSYVLACVFSHMPNVKAPLAHQEVLTMLAECVADFGIAVCNPRAVVDFAKGNQALESSNPKCRASATSLLGVMYSQLGPALLPILGLETWKPALASSVQSEFQRVGFDASTALIRIKRHARGEEEASRKGSGSADMTALFGRKDVSNQITKELLEDLRNEQDMAAWKKRLAAMETIQMICEASGCAIEFTKPVVEVMRNLKARLNDSNSNLKVKAAQVIGIMATSIGPDVFKLSKILGDNLVRGVSDNKKNMQQACVEALHRWVRHGGKTSGVCVESLLSILSEALLNPVGRGELLGWAVEHVRESDKKLEMHSLISPTIQCLMDKSSDTRDKAQQFLAEVLKSVGKDAVMNDCRDIKPAQMRTLKPMIQKVFDSVGDSHGPVLPQPPMSMNDASSMDVSMAGDSSISGSRTRMMRANSTPVKANSSRLPLARNGSTFGLQQQRSNPRMVIEEDSMISGDGGQLAPTAQGPMLVMHPGKPARLARGQYNRWIFEISPDQIAARSSELQSEWRSYLQGDMEAHLFAVSYDKGMFQAISELTFCVGHHQEEVIAHLDFILKWSTLRIVDNNVQALSKMLEFLVQLLEMLIHRQYQLEDVEAQIFLPYLLQESGNAKPRFRLRFRDLMRLVTQLYPSEKYVNGFLIEGMNTCKNVKSRCECIGLMEFLVSTRGYASVGKKSVREMAKYLTVHEKELRESALDAMVTVFLRTDGNLERFVRFCGIVQQQAVDLLSMRIKHLPPDRVPDGSMFNGTPGAVGGMEPIVPPGPAPIMPPAPAPIMPPAPAPIMPGVMHTPVSMTVSAPHNEQTVTSLPMTPQRPQRDVDDVVMESVEKKAAELETIEDLLIRPIERLVVVTGTSKRIVEESSPAYSNGVDAMKGMYAIVRQPTDEAERQFLRTHVNDIMLRLWECVHASFHTEQVHWGILSVSLATMSVLLKTDVVESIQRYYIEQMLLVIGCNLLDPRLEAVVDESPEQKRFALVRNALNQVTNLIIKRCKAGDLFPSVVNLLQRLVRNDPNDVGDYNSRESFNHLMQQDSLDQLVGRILCKIAMDQAQMIEPFEGVDVFGVLMQMHSFFSTLPMNELFATQHAQQAMQETLRLMVESLKSTRPSVLEAALQDLPITSPVRELLVKLGLIVASASSSTSSFTGSTSTGFQSGSGSFGETNGMYSSSYSMASSSVPTSSPSSKDSVMRKLWPSSSLGNANPTSDEAISSMTSGLSNTYVSSTHESSNGVGTGMDHEAKSRFHGSSLRANSSRGFGFGFQRSTVESTSTSLERLSEPSSSSSFGFGASSSSASVGSSVATSTTTRLLRERLERVRQF